MCAAFQGIVLCYKGVPPRLEGLGMRLPLVGVSAVPCLSLAFGGSRGILVALQLPLSA